MSEPAVECTSAEAHDLVLVGGGLQNGLIALAALDARPERRVVVVEATHALGGNHTWCVHPDDVPKHAWRWLEPLVERRWPGYEVRFPELCRTLSGTYAALTSERFSRHLTERLAAAPGGSLMLGAEAREVHADHVLLADGRRVYGQLIVDARGPQPDAFQGSAGFQKFLGLELELKEPHGRALPLLMDATVAQTDGFRFLYCLPLDERRLLVEDTSFSLSPALDLDDAPVLEYAARFGHVQRVLRREHGVLPMPWQSDFPEPSGSPLVAGYRGGWFHPATGYSFPTALRLALHLAQHDGASAMGRDFQRLFRQHRQQVRYAEHLNYLLFHGFEADAMRNVFERFYKLPAGLIDRFYALSMSFTDRARIMVGSPPRGFQWSAALGAARRFA